MTDVTQIVPETFETRQRIRSAARAWVTREKLLPPQTLERLTAHARRCLAELSLDAAFENFTMIMLNNALWEGYFPSVPKDQRLLLLPFCLRNHQRCQAPRDDLGLICAQCGACALPQLMEQAEALGMPVLVAESSSCVAEWVEAGEIQAVVGVSCLKSLEKAFPAMLRHAVPGVAIPLTADGCADTAFDAPFLQDALSIAERGGVNAFPYAEIRRRLNALFTANRIKSFLQPFTPHLTAFPEEICRVLGANGKHYRPMITYGVYCALTHQERLPEFLDPVALAVECFHKASLIHDDIEDGDDLRYGEPTLHCRLGLASALNAGDFLIGAGYRLLGHSSVPIGIQAQLYAQAAQAHCELSLGQAQEFEAAGKAVTLEHCLETHRLKTAPAFRVALHLGAIAAGQFEQCRDLFHRFADLLGLSYQLFDDLEDAGKNPASAVDCLMRQNALNRKDARREIARLYEAYRMKTYDVLEEVVDPSLKIFLYRLIGKVLQDA